MTYGRGQEPMAIAHRGGAGLAPENTLAAFALATGLGLRYLETDVRLTADGRLVCFHDATLDRVTDACGPLRARTLAELAPVRVDGCEPIPTLAGLLTAFPSAYVAVDLKETEAIGELARVVGDAGATDRVCVAGAWDGVLAQVRAQMPGVATALGWASLTTLVTSARAGIRAPKSLATAPFAHVPVRLGRVPVFVDRLVRLAHDLGVQVVTWTVDDAAAMHRLLDCGVDGVITDRPDTLREVLLARGQWRGPATQPTTQTIGPLSSH